MSRRRVTLVTGANGEVGQALIRHLATHRSGLNLIALDKEPLPDALQRQVARTVTGDIRDKRRLDLLAEEVEIDTIFHLAAVLSTNAEANPRCAHEVNVQGTLNLLEVAAKQTQLRGMPVTFIFPSSIAVYGLPNLETKRQAGTIRESEYLQPTTIYGCNKRYCELLGNYFANHYRLLKDPASISVDFRCVRFPGIISSQTVPTGGTSDYAPEMLHAAAHGRSYVAFVRGDTQIPFMVMPDAVKALLMLAVAPAESLGQCVYNVAGFSLPAVDIAARIRKSIATTSITFEPDGARQRILDTWPMDVHDEPARTDWGWAPDFNVDRAFNEYLSPERLRNIGC